VATKSNVASTKSNVASTMLPVASTLLLVWTGPYTAFTTHADDSREVRLFTSMCLVYRTICQNR